MGKIAYVWGRNIYLNLTNRCPTACRFCIKKEWGWRYRSQDLLLAKEPSVDQAWSQLRTLTAENEPEEIVFCGYGEPTYRLPELRELCRRVRRVFPWTMRRLNTIGLGSLIWKRDIVPELAQCLNAVSISLNTADKKQWTALHEPAGQFRKKGYDAVLAFARNCVLRGLDTTLTAVEQPGVDLEACSRLAHTLGVQFRLRPRLATLLQHD